jgi:uncharacterized protein
MDKNTQKGYDILDESDTSPGMIGLLPGIFAVDLSLLITKKTDKTKIRRSAILVLGDLHIGYEEALNRSGVLLPRDQVNEIIERLDKIFRIISRAKVRISAIIINGDLKHEFGEISEQEWRDTLKILDYLKEKCGKIILIKGNHDTILGPIAKKREITIADHFFSNDVYICHGDILPKDTDRTKIDCIISGHVHPSVLLHDGTRREKYKAFLVGKWQGKDLVVMPSFSTITYGFDLINEKNRWPILEDAENARIYIASDKIYDFGLLKELKAKHQL